MLHANRLRDRLGVDVAVVQTDCRRYSAVWWPASPLSHCILLLHNRLRGHSEPILCVPSYHSPPIMFAINRLTQSYTGNRCYATYPPNMLSPITIEIRCYATQYRNPLQHTITQHQPPHTAGQPQPPHTPQPGRPQSPHNLRSQPSDVERPARRILSTAPNTPLMCRSSTPAPPSQPWIYARDSLGSHSHRPSSCANR